MQTKVSLIVLLASSLLAMPAAHAATKVPVANATMEASVTLGAGEWITLPSGTGTYTSTDPLPGWKVDGPDAGVAAPASQMFTKPYQSGDFLFVGGTLGNNGGFSQTFEKMRANQKYTITLDVGWRLDTDCSGYRILVLLDGVAGQTFESADCHELTRGSFTPLAFTFPSTAGKTLGVRLTTITPGGNVQIDYDNFKLSRVKIPAQ